ncbi:TRAP transporter substrate-binding protein DctP [Pararhizobium mangrovi]|uniref:C4-dicarboxylate ABC transporter substrate-binding protein n=1 Tax=Pararhizobium mangrovi TaxID=2590452 RepID=A0A506UAR0_9HYPH|nr:TRAP transporter substrate-binding protein DctP [Pararhizobium mangrovi]TPW30191.1 C4-dicarboxylate ABC transporter substrate-binding protein [Pararhizobium mangrovi]
MRIIGKLFVSSALLALTVSPGLAKETTINAVHFTPAQNTYAQSFLKFVDEVNKAGKGVVKINVRGGPEVLPPDQQGEAQKNGLIDMLNTPAGLYLNLVPEGEAFSASTKSPEEVRENGGWDLMQKIYAKKGNAHLLAHIDAGAGFHIFTVDQPKKTDDGGIDWSKLKIRSSPLYRTFLENLGATVIVQSPGEIYTSLERGVVNANAYTILGYQSFGWDKFTKYRVDPSFFQTDVLISMNKDKWDSLSPEAQKILTDTAKSFEKESAEAVEKDTKEQAQQMIDAGQKIVTLSGKGKDEFLSKASKASWQRMESRDPTYISELRKHFQ